MIIGDLHLWLTCLTGEEKPRKNFTQKTCPDRGSNSGPLRGRRACYCLLHSGGCWVWWSGRLCEVRWSSSSPSSRNWSSKNSRVVTEHKRDSPKWSVWCGIMRNRIIGLYLSFFLFFFLPRRRSPQTRTYLDMLPLYVVPQLPDGTIYQKDGAPPHFANIVRTFLDEQILC